MSDGGVPSNVAGYVLNLIASLLRTWPSHSNVFAVLTIVYLKYGPADTLLVLPCKHFFHRSCIMR